GTELYPSNEFLRRRNRGAACRHRADLDMLHRIALGQVHLRASAFISYSIASLCHSSAMRSYAWRRAGSVAYVASSVPSTDRPKKFSDKSDITAQSSGTRSTSSQVCSCPQNLQGIVRRVWSLTNAVRSISIPVIIIRPDFRHRYTSWATGLPPFSR